MVKKGSPKDIEKKSYKLKIEKRIREEYKEYLEATGQQSSYDSAHFFALKKIKENGGFKYLDYSESQIILFLEGELPPFY